MKLSNLQIQTGLMCSSTVCFFLGLFIYLFYFSVEQIFKLLSLTDFLMA